MDAKAYADGDKAGREGKPASTNPHAGSGPSLLAAIVVGPFAGMLGSEGDKSKASDWADGHKAGSSNKK